MTATIIAVCSAVAAVAGVITTWIKSTHAQNDAAIANAKSVNTQYKLQAHIDNPTADTPAGTTPAS